MDRRTKRQKLEAMANQNVSPQEAEIARRKLKELKKEPKEFINSFNNFTTFTVNVTFTGTSYLSFWDAKQKKWVNISDAVFASGFGEY
jgi:hypothetical protein